MIFWLRVEKEIIVKASAESHGCLYAMATSMLVAQHIEGMTLPQARELDARSLEIMVGGLPEGKDYYAEMAALALTQVVSVDQS